jgi:hypothetical protein
MLIILLCVAVIAVALLGYIAYRLEQMMFVTNGWAKVIYTELSHDRRQQETSDNLATWAEQRNSQ